MMKIPDARHAQIDTLSTSSFERPKEGLWPVVVTNTQTLRGIHTARRDSPTCVLLDLLNATNKHNLCQTAENMFYQEEKKVNDTMDNSDLDSDIEKVLWSEASHSPY